MLQYPSWILPKKLTIRFSGDACESQKLALDFQDLLARWFTVIQRDGLVPTCSLQLGIRQAGVSCAHRYSSLGNHDVLGGIQGVNEQIAYTKKNAAWYLPARCAPATCLVS